MKETCANFVCLRTVVLFAKKTRNFVMICNSERILLQRNFRRKLYDEHCNYYTTINVLRRGRLSDGRCARSSLARSQHVDRADRKYEKTGRISISIQSTHHRLIVVSDFVSEYCQILTMKFEIYSPKMSIVFIK